MIIRIGLGLVISGGLLACTPSTEPASFMRRPATLQHFSDGPHVSAPASARVGQPFQVTFTAYGGGCVEKARNELQVRDLTADVHSFQIEHLPPPGAACTDELRIEVHTITLSFATTGTARVRIFGQKHPGASPLTLEQSVTVTQ